MYSEDELLPISGLQHLAFCERQAALIHVEGLWADNVLTAEGHLLHERVHRGELETHGEMRVARGLRLRSLALGLTGMTDVVEFRRVHGEGDAGACSDHFATELPGVAGRWRPFLVEYKRGLPKPDNRDEVQLCAQAMCLEEMLGVTIPAAALYYGRPRRRHPVPLDQQLRTETISLAGRLHRLVASGTVPPPSYSRRCRRCSLVDHCLPKMARSAASVEKYLRQAVTGGELS